MSRPSNDFDVQGLAAQLRVDSIRCSTRAGSGHATSSLSAADLMAVLMSSHFVYDWDRPDEPANDHLIFSKGHASPLLYSMFRAAGVIDENELIDTYRQAGSRLQGHPTPELPWVDVATGSLGQGLPDAVGVALAGRYLDKIPYHVWTLCGDSEMAEGSVWEALDKAGYYRLGNLTAIVDVNRLGQQGPTEFEWDLDSYRRRAEAFGALVLEVDGHDVGAIDGAMTTARGQSDRPTVILAKTIKAKGVPEIENENGWHGKALPADMAEQAIEALGGPTSIHVDGQIPQPASPAITAAPGTAVSVPTWAQGEEVSTRAAFGKALAALSARPEIVALDGEVGNSTHAGDFEDVCPERFFQMYIAEQQMVAGAVGMSVRGYVPFAASFAAFLTSRAFDFIRMAAISGADVRLVGSHAGCEIGADGPSQMALEDIAMMRAVHGSTVLYPCDANSTAKLVTAMADMDGISYLRATRGGYPVLYDPDEEFVPGGSKMHRAGPDDQVTLVGAGVTVHECLKAAEQLAEVPVRARVMDLYSLKPLDRTGLIAAARETGGNVVVVEDHYPEGGVAAAVLEALAGVSDIHVESLAVQGLPGSGSPGDMLDTAGISARHIVTAARQLVGA